MHTSILLALWTLGSYILYRLVAFLLTERRHSQASARLRCQQPPRFIANDPIGIKNVRGLMAADKTYTIPQILQKRFDDAVKREGKLLTTWYHNVLGSPAVVTIEPRNIQTVLATQFKDFGLGSTRNNNFWPLLGYGIFSSDGAQWEHSRALLRPQFARDLVSDLDLEERHVHHMMRLLEVNPGGWTDTVDLLPMFFRLTFDSATEFLFGESADSQLSTLPGYTSSRPPMEVDAKAFAVAFDQAQRGLATGARFGDMYKFAHTKEFKEQCRKCHAYIDHYVQIALSKEKSSSNTTSTGKQKYVFLDALAESTCDPIELRSQLLNILLAGRDTTASLLSYLFMIFTERPDVYNKLRSIILEDFGTYTNPKEITFSGLKSCAYLQHVLNETLRLYPVVPIDGRRALRDTTLPTGGGPDGTAPVYIRKDQQVDYSVFVMHRRKDLWGEDAEEFRPERWESRRSGWEYLPFNGGPRICIGQQFALTEAGFVTVRLLQRFEECIGVGNSWESVEKGGYGYIRHNLTLTSCPADGVKVRLREARE